tara:strand:+ start:656 stop:934 length:279 start_codon:yes stop_codon:yes gene_type:complete
MDATSKFEKLFLKMLEEDMTTGASFGGSNGGYNPGDGDINSSDWYAPGDARNPTPDGKVQARKKKKKKKKKKVYLPGENEEYQALLDYEIKV